MVDIEAGRDEQQPGRDLDGDHESASPRSAHAPNSAFDRYPAEHHDHQRDTRSQAVGRSLRVRRYDAGPARFEGAARHH